MFSNSELKNLNDRQPIIHILLKCQPNYIGISILLLLNFVKKIA